MKKLFCTICFIASIAFVTGCNLAVYFPVEKTSGYVRLYVSDGSVNTNALLRGVCGFPVISDLTDSVVKELDLSVIYPDGNKQEYSKKTGTLKYDASSIIVEGLSAGVYNFKLKIVTTFSTYEAKGNGQISSASNRPIVLKVEKVTPHIVLYSDNATGADEFYFAPDPENSKVVYKVGGLTFKETSSDPQKQLFTFDKQGRFYYMGTFNQLYDGLSNSGVLTTQGAFCVDTTNNHLYYTTNNSLNASVIKKVGISPLEGSTGQAISPGNVFSCLAYFDDYIDTNINGPIKYKDKRYIVGYHVRYKVTGSGTTTTVPSVRLYCTTELTTPLSGNIKITEAASSGDMGEGTNIAYDIAMVKKPNGEVKIFVLMHNGSPTSPEHQAMGNYTVTINSSQHVITGTPGNNRPLIEAYNNSEGGVISENICGQRFLGHRGTKLYIAGKGTDDSGNIIVFDYKEGTKKKISLLGFKDEDGNPVTIKF
jgi:lipoprotein